MSMKTLLSVDGELDLSSGGGSLQYLELNEFFLQPQVRKTLRVPSDYLPEFTHVLSALKLGAKFVSQSIRKTNTFCSNSEFKSASKFDSLDDTASQAHKMFIEALLKRRVVAGIASQQEGGFFPVPSCEEKSFVVLLNALDGMQHIDVNVSVGTIFSIYKRVTPAGTEVKNEDFLQAGKNQVCAGYVLYGTSTIMVLTLGGSVHGFTVDPGLGAFYLSHSKIMIPQRGPIYSINSGKMKHFPTGVREFIANCQKDKLSFRYIGSLVADFHRNMLKGGIFIYPPTFLDYRPSVSLVFQCFPLAFIAEQAGGKASDGFTRILEIEPVSFDDRLPFFCGSYSMVHDAEIFMANKKMHDGGWYLKEIATNEIASEKGTPNSSRGSLQVLSPTSDGGSI